MKFRKRPVIIEAHRWYKNGDHPEDYAKEVSGLQTIHGDQVFVTWTGEQAREKEWEGQIVRYFRHPDVSGDSLCRYCNGFMHTHGWIDTREGGHIVCPGDWIVKGVRGEFYPVKDEIFLLTYEPVELNPIEGGGSLDELEAKTTRR